MEVHSLDAMTRGWFVGDFAPAVLRTSACEVALHRHPAGYRCEPHWHALTPEINLIVSGRLCANGRELGAGDIFVYAPGEVCDVAFLEDSAVVVVKAPSVPGDKYLAQCGLAVPSGAKA